MDYHPNALTPKEWLIVRLVTCGLKNEAIGKALGYTKYGTANKLKVIYDKTGMSTRLELALWYLAKRNEWR